MGIDFQIAVCLLGGVLFGLLLLVAQHLAGERVTCSQALVAGSFLGWLVLTPIGLLIGLPFLGVAVLIVYAVAGAMVALVWYARQRLAELDHTAYQAGRAAAPLTQDDIDAGERR